MELEFPGEIHPLFSNGAFVVPTMTQIELQLNAAPKMPEYSLSYFLGSEPLHKLRDEHALRQPFDVLRDVLMSYYSRDLSLNTSPCSIFLVSPNPIALESWVYICADMLGLHIEQPDLAETLDRRENIKDVILGAFERALSRTPSILFLPDVEMLQPTGDSEDQIVHIVKTIMTSMRSCLSSDTSTPVFIAGSYSIAALQPDIESMFLHVVIENIPTIAQSSSFLSNVMRLYSVPSMANIDSASKKLAGSSYDILKKTFVCALKEARRRSVPCFIRKQNDQNAFDLSLRHVQPVLIDIDFEIAIGSSRKMGLSRFTSGVGMQKVSWDDVGGMSLAKKMVIEIITLPLEYYDLMPKNLKRGPGILLYGPPGTGKTFLARAIASNLGLNFLAIKGPELVSAYVGESESNIREVFAAARESSPCLLFFDEIDSISKERGMGRSSGFVNDRLVAQLLAEFDTISSDNSRYHDQHVFIIGATNRPDMLDPALLRSGRLDRMVYLGPCESQEEVISVLKALTRRYTILISDNLLHPASLNPVFTQRRFLLHTSLNLDQIAQHIPLPITNADLYGICSQAHLNATRRVIEALNTHESENYREEKINIPDIIVTSEDFLSTIALYRPSVDTSLFSYYRELHKTLETTNM